MALMRHAVLVLVLLAASSSLASAQPAAQSDSLAVVFTPHAGTFVGSETVTLSVQARASIHYTLDGSLPTVMSPVYRGPSPSRNRRASGRSPSWLTRLRRDPSPRKSTCAWTRIR